MPTAAIAFLLALIGALTLTPVARWLADQLGAIDHALGSRRVHGRPIPRLGGLAIVAAFYFALAGLVIADGAALALFLDDRAGTAALLLGGLAIAGLGLHDDLHGASAGSKLLVEVSVAGLLYAAGFRIDLVALPFLEPVALGWLGLPVTLLWVAGVVNAVNLVDGLDGLAAGVALVGATATCVLAAAGGNPLAALLAAALGGAALGFLPYNFHPASIFMGDTGSLFLGFVLAATSIRTQHDPSNAVGLLSAALVLGGSALDAAVLATLALAGPAALWQLGALRLPRLADLNEARRRNQVLRSNLDRVRRRLRRAGDWNEVWPAVRQAADVLGAGSVVLRIAAPAAGQPGASFEAGAPGSGLLSARAPLAPGAAASTLELRWRDRAALDRDTEIALEILGGDVSSALGRIQRQRRRARPALPSLAAPRPPAVQPKRERVA